MFWREKKLLYLYQDGCKHKLHTMLIYNPLEVVFWNTHIHILHIDITFVCSIVQSTFQYYVWCSNIIFDFSISNLRVLTLYLTFSTFYFMLKYVTWGFNNQYCCTWGWNVNIFMITIWIGNIHRTFTTCTLNEHNRSGQ